MSEWEYHPGCIFSAEWRSKVCLGGTPVLALSVYDGALGEVLSVVDSYTAHHVTELCRYDECDDVEEGKRIAIELAREVVRGLAKEIEVIS